MEDVHLLLSEPCGMISTPLRRTINFDMEILPERVNRADGSLWTSLCS